MKVLFVFALCVASAHAYAPAMRFQALRQRVAAPRLAMTLSSSSMPSAAAVAPGMSTTALSMATAVEADKGMVRGWPAW